tara:strand:+ start:234 stop:392 length:159 start_codon:yes stop_codon:yes gene_type:complete
MNQSSFNEFFPQLSQKGYTLKECAKPVKTKPDWFNGTYEEYCDAIHDFMNGM